MAQPTTEDPKDPKAVERQRALHRLQVYRRLCGLPWQGMQLVPEWNVRCDAASEVCRALGGLERLATPLEQPVQRGLQVERGGGDPGIGHQVLEVDEGMFQWGLKAAAFGLPFLPTRVGLGTDLAALGGLKTVTSPYADGETLIAMPALKLDAALIHVNRSDWRGNIQAFGPDVYYDEWFARAAAKTFVSCEELVDRMEDHYPQDARANVFERCFVSGVTEIACGAHPSSMPPLYGPDMKAFKAYADAARDPGDWGAVTDRFVGDNEAAYLDSLGGKEAVMNIPLAIY